MLAMYHEFTKRPRFCQKPTRRQRGRFVQGRRDDVYLILERLSPVNHVNPELEVFISKSPECCLLCAVVASLALPSEGSRVLSIWDSSGE